MSNTDDDTMRTVVAELQKTHQLSERHAASIALTVATVAHMTLRPKVKGSRCPFNDTAYRIGTNDPCPVCGSLGSLGAPDFCIDRKKS